MSSATDQTAPAAEPAHVDARYCVRQAVATLHKAAAIVEAPEICGALVVVAAEWRHLALDIARNAPLAPPADN